MKKLKLLVLLIFFLGITSFAQRLLAEDFISSSNSNPSIKLSVTNVTASSLRIFWPADSKSKAVGYIICSKREGEEGWARLAHTKDLFYDDIKLDPNTFYTYRICSINGNNELKGCAEITEQTASIPTKGPGIPRDLRLVSPE